MSIMFRKRELKYHVYCGGRSSQHTFNAFVQIYTYAKENGYNKIIVDFIDPETIDLKKENLQLKEKIEKAIEYINKSLIISNILDGKKTYCLNNYTFDYKELLDILKEVSE